MFLFLSKNDQYWRIQKYNWFKIKKNKKDARVARHFQIDKEMMRRHVIDKVRKFEEKIHKINEDKDKTGQEKINTIMEKYYKTQETLV